MSMQYQLNVSFTIFTSSIDIYSYIQGVAIIRLTIIKELDFTILLFTWVMTNDNTNAIVVVSCSGLM